ncbi:Ras-related protein Rab-12, partial [Chelonia mydas]
VYCILFIGVDFKIKTVELRGKKIRLQIWDTAGQERFNSITSAYYRSAKGIILVYDITKKETFEDLPKWMKMIDKYASEDAELLLVGNKLDCEADREITRQQGEKFAQQITGMRFCEASAKDNFNVDEIFLKLVDDILKKQPAVGLASRWGAIGLHVLPLLRAPALHWGSGGAMPMGESRMKPLACLHLGAGPAPGCFRGTVLYAVPRQAGSLPLHPSCAADQEPPEELLFDLPPAQIVGTAVAFAVGVATVRCQLWLLQLLAPCSGQQEPSDRVAPPMGAARSLALLDSLGLSTLPRSPVQGELRGAAVPVPAPMPDGAGSYSIQASSIPPG